MYNTRVGKYHQHNSWLQLMRRRNQAKALGGLQLEENLSNTKETWEKKRRSETHAAELWLFDVARNHEESWNIIHTHSLVGLYFKKEEVINVFLNNSPAEPQKLCTHSKTDQVKDAVHVPVSWRPSPGISPIDWKLLSLIKCLTLNSRKRWPMPQW